MMLNLVLKLFRKEFLILFLVLLQPSSSIASSKPHLFWSGFAFLGDFDQRNTRYPYTSKIILNSEKQRKQSPIDRKISLLLNNFSSENFQLNTSMAQNSDSLFAGLGVAYEDIYKIKTDDKYKVSYEVGLNFMVFNFQEKKIVAIYPMRFLRNEIYDKDPDEQEHENIFNNLYTGDEFNILQEALNKIANVQIKESIGNYIGVSKVKLENNSERGIPASLDLDSIKTSIAQEFEGFLSINNQVPLVPYTKGEIIGKDMAVRFSDRSRITFSLPDTDYNIEIRVRGFDFKMAKRHYGYTVKITVLASDDLHPELVKLNLSKNIWILKRGSGDIDDKLSQWLVYKEALSILLKEFTQQIHALDENWFKMNSINRDAVLQTKKLKRLINKSK